MSEKREACATVDKKGCEDLLVELLDGSIQHFMDAYLHCLQLSNETAKTAYKKTLEDVSSTSE